MKNHVLRPLWVALGIVALVLAARIVLVPDDFGVHGRNFTFGYHRLGNIDEWKAFEVKYRGREVCIECHEDKAESTLRSRHGVIECENCHGLALAHPDNPQRLSMDRSRGLCLRCHASLPYPSSLRSQLKGIDPDHHNAGEECVQCHDPHNPDLEDMQ